MLRVFTRNCSSIAGSMVRILNVAEKNDAAKSLSELMSRGPYRRRDGFSRFNKIYEFEYNILNQQNVTMTMTSVSGHLLNYGFAAGYRKWYSCNPVALFEAPVAKQCPQDYQDIKRTLEREVRGCQTLVIWTDCDREGENIGFEIIQVCKAVKPNIRIYRARFSEITPAAVNRACANLIAPNKNVSDAVDVRSELDLRIGAAFTRFQTMRLQKAFPNVLADQLISYGSCQFPTLGFVVERYKQVQAFIPEPFWKISVHHETDDGAVEFTWKRNRLFDYLACLVLYEHCLETPLARVTEVKCKPKSKWRPQALDTVELEKLASRKLKIGAKDTMKIAEKLYTQGYISYPRTETNIFPKELDLRPLVQAQTEDQRWGGFAAGVVERGPTPRNGNKTDQAHPPIHPLKYTNNLQGNEAKVYEFIVRHFLACCSQDAQGQETTVEINIADELFSSSGLMILARNYLDVYPYDRWTAKVIPRFEQGQEFQPNVIELNQGETSPPQLLTEADLITLMDKHGIGTDATHAEHIETIKSRLYVGVRPDGRFVPGELGMGLVEGYDAMGYQMSKPNLRAELERDLQLICDGRKNSEEVLVQQVQNYRQVFIEAVQQAPKIDSALSEYFGQAQQYTPTEINIDVSMPVKKCRKCGEDMVIKKRKDGKSFFLSCMGYPDCKEAIWFPETVLAASVLDTVCNSCQGSPRLIKFKFKRGSVPGFMPLEYEGCIGGCDGDLREVLNLRMQPPSQPTQRNPRGNDSGVGSSAGSSRGSGRPSGGRGTQGSQRSQDSGFGGTQSRSFSSQSNMRTPAPSTASDTHRPSMLGGAVGRLNNNNPRPGTSQPPPGGGSGGAGGGGGGGAVIVCSCGDDARQLTVRKEGPNTGRQFFVCPKPQDVKCDFFLWADDGGKDGETTTQPPRNNFADRGAAARPPRGNYRSNGGDSMGTGAHQCNCGDMAKQLTVQKDGPNKGRQFFACPKPRGQGCDFFQWQDETGSADGSGMGTQRGQTGFGTRTAGFDGYPAQNNIQRSNWGDAPGTGGEQCNCGDPAKLLDWRPQVHHLTEVSLRGDSEDYKSPWLTVQKDGPNKGRQFFACPKPRGQGCGFFQWQDEAGSGSLPLGDANRDQGGSRKRAAPDAGRKQPVAKRTMTCSVCRQPGHRKNKCPRSNN